MMEASARPLVANDVDFGALRSSLGFLLRMAQLKVFENFYEALGAHGLKPGSFSVLWIIYLNPGIRQGVLAERLMIKRAHMTKLVRAFEERELVVRTIPDDDRRGVELSLTSRGRDFVESNSATFFRGTEAELSQLSSEEQRQIVRLLQKIVGLEAGGAA